MKRVFDFLQTKEQLTQVISREFHISKSFREADEWTKRQYREMSPAERIEVARELQRRFFGSNPPDVRKACRERSK